jgi:hypothetical protein
MAPQYGFLAALLGMGAVTMMALAILYPRTIKEYWLRSCMGRAWKRTFPRASKADIREFLYLFVDAFAFPRRRALQFAPSDRVLSVYGALYPLKGSPDALELETFALRLERRYSLDLRSMWRENLTLGEIFSNTNRPLA